MTDEELDKSLDEVSNVIHDIITEEKYEDTDEKVNEVIAQAEIARKIPKKVVESILEPKETPSDRHTFDEFIDERLLISRDAFGRKEMKIKILEVSDEKAPSVWKLGDRVKVDKIIVTIKHLETQEIEEAEFDIKAIEKKLAKERHYSSTNRWVPITDIKKGYVMGSRHTTLVSDAIALDCIIF